MRPQLRPFLLPALLAAVLCASLPSRAAASDGLWLHLDVRNGDGEGNLTVDLPMSLVRAVASLLPDHARASGRIRIDDREIEPAELRRIWREVRLLPEARIATFEDRDGRLRVSKRGGNLVFQAFDRKGRGGEATVRIPAPVVDALLSGRPDELDLAAAIDAFARTGQGELVTVNDDRDTVRIWVNRDEGR